MTSDRFGPTERRHLYVLLAMQERASRDVEWRDSMRFDTSKRASERDALAWAVAEIDRLTAQRVA